MSRLVLIGGGGHCISVLDAALRMNAFQEIVILDPRLPVGSMIMWCTVVGNDDKLPELREKGFDNAFITVGSIGDTSLRRKLAEKANLYGFTYPCIIDPSAIVSEFANIEPGVFVGKNAVINAGAEIGKHAIINSGAIVEHDCRVGSFTHVAVGATVCGGCTIEEDAFIGAGSTLIQGLTIERCRFIKAGEVVVR